MTQYCREIAKRISNRTDWPNFDRPDFLNELNGIAEESFLHDTLEGYLGALLIYHQLAEEMLKLLLEDAQFLIQLKLYPTPIQFPTRRRQMFGQLIDSLESTLDFELKSEVIGYAGDMNKRRIRMVHGLTKESSADNIADDARWVRSCFELFFNCFTKAHQSFLRQFEEEQSRRDWSEMPRLRS